LTGLISRADARAPANLGAALDLQGHSHQVRIPYIGQGGLFVETRELPPLKDPSVVVRFSVLTSDGLQTIRCNCEVEAITAGAGDSPPGLDLSITGVGDDSQERLLNGYVRWLHMRAIANA